MFMLMLSMVLSVLASQDFRARVVVEEGGEEASYLVDFKTGALRIEPEQAGVHLLMDLDSRTVTLIRSEERDYVRLDREGFRRLMEWGTIEASWFPWVWSVSPDLVENLQLEESGSFRLPDGRKGLRLSATCPSYDRTVAEYWLDPEGPGELFFQWCAVYIDFWGAAGDDDDEAQEKRLRLYSRLSGLPVKMEERFVLLSRARTLRLEDREPIPVDAFTIPEDFVEKTESQLRWDSLLRRLERWLREFVEPQ